MALVASRSIGNAGTMEIHDNGSTVLMRIRSSDGATYSGGIPITVYVHGGWTGWFTVPYPGGSPWVTVWSGSVSTTQYVEFVVGDTGTWGFGDGYRLLGATISRATVPPAPTMLTPENITQTTARIRFNGNGDGGSSIIRWELQRATNSSFTENVQTVTSSGTTNYSDLTPATTYYFRSRGVNSVGNGHWSSTQSITTLPAGPPGISIMPGLSGTTATVTLSPPGGASGVTKYNVERRTIGGPATPYATTSTVLNVDGLTPGVAYEWRANAEFGPGYTSPWSGWVLSVSPNPNTTPGDYFDGDSEAKPDLSYAWTGTPHASTSQAIGAEPEGWEATSVSVDGDVRLQRITGGRSGDFSARALVVRRTVGITVGMDSAEHRSEVEADILYVGSIYIRPGLEVDARAEVLVYDESNSLIDTILGDVVNITDTVGWTRLSASLLVPPGGSEVAVRAAVEPSGASHLESGEFVDADDAMVTLGTITPWFSGDTTDTAEFAYGWQGEPNASVSERILLQQELVDPLADPDCVTPPSPPSLPQVPADCLEEISLWRRYTAQIPPSAVGRWTVTLPTFTLETGPVGERQVRLRTYPNPDNLPPEMIDMDAWESEVIISWLPPNTVLTLDGITQRAWAAVPDGREVPANRLLYGTGGTPATWPELRCGVGYIVTFDVPLDAPPGNLTVSAALTQRTA